MLQNLDCFSDRLIPEKPCKHEVSLFMNLRRLAVTTGEWWLQTVQSSCTGAKKSAAQMHCDGGHHVFIQLSHPGFSYLIWKFQSTWGHKKTSQIFRLLVFKNLQMDEKMYYFEKKVWEKRNMGVELNSLLYER